MVAAESDHCERCIKVIVAKHATSGADRLAAAVALAVTLISGT